MKMRVLGGGLEVSALGLGCMPMVGRGTVHYGAADETESLATLDRAIELGVTFFDTAEAYGPFTNEAMLARAIKGRRDGLIIATKFAFRFDADGATLDSSPETVKRACEGSLRRLGVDTIDLFYQHRVDPKTPIEDTVGAVAELVREGKVRHIGLSEASAATLRRAHAVHPIAALQSEYSLWERGVEDEILPTCRALGVGFVPYSPLGRGFLTGQVARTADMARDDYRRLDPRFEDGNFEANENIVLALQSVATGHGVSAAQVALAWLLAQGGDIAPIPGCKRRKTLEDSMAAADLRLDAENLSLLDLAAPRGRTHGPRYRASLLRSVNL